MLVFLLFCFFNCDTTIHCVFHSNYHWTTKYCRISLGDTIGHVSKSQIQEIKELGGI